VAFRKQKAAECGIGFELPNTVSIVPKVPKNSAKTKRRKLRNQLNRRDEMVGPRGRFSNFSGDSWNA
jgi:hypothetical protein